MISASSLALGLNLNAKKSSRSFAQFRIGPHYPIRRFLPARMKFSTGTALVVVIFLRQLI